MDKRLELIHDIIKRKVDGIPRAINGEAPKEKVMELIDEIFTLKEIKKNIIDAMD